MDVYNAFANTAGGRLVLGVLASDAGEHKSNIKQLRQYIQEMSMSDNDSLAQNRSTGFPRRQREGAQGTVPPHSHFCAADKKKSALPMADGMDCCIPTPGGGDAPC